VGRWSLGGTSRFHDGRIYFERNLGTRQNMRHGRQMFHLQPSYHLLLHRQQQDAARTPTTVLSPYSDQHLAQKLDT
jgi:hypothetical protein